MLGSLARRRFLAPASSLVAHIRATLAGSRAWYSSDFDLGKKPGDWDCTSCFHLNFSKRDSCQRCGSVRPLGAGGESRGWGGGGEVRGWGSGNSNVKPGDWFCASCNTHNFASRSTCFKCGIEKSDSADGNNDGKPGWRSGDWICSGCKEHNFANRTECFKCNAPKQEEEAA